MKPTFLTSTLLTIILMFSTITSGQSLSPLFDVEQQAMNNTFQYALEYNKTNQVADWANSYSARSGSVVPVQTFLGAQGQPCRKYITTITVGSWRQKGYGTACRNPDGSWYTEGYGRPVGVISTPNPSMSAYPFPGPYYGSSHTYYNPYPVSFSFSLGYLFDNGSLYIGNYYPMGLSRRSQLHWQPYRSRYYAPNRLFPHYRPSFRTRNHPYYKPNNRTHFRPVHPRNYRPNHRHPFRR